MNVVPARRRSAADRRLSGPVVRALRRRRRADVHQLQVDAAVELDGWRAPGGIPAASSVDRVLSATAAAHRLPDGTWVHLPAVLDGLVLTRRAPDHPALVALDGSLDLIARRFRGWQRIPVAIAGRWGMGELLVIGPRTLVALPRPLEPTRHDGPVVAVCIGPEGLRVDPTRPDRDASLALRGALAATPPWAVTDRLLLALTRDPALGRRPSAPIVVRTAPGATDIASDLDVSVRVAAAT